MDKLPKAVWVALSAILVLLIYVVDPWKSLQGDGGDLGSSSGAETTQADELMEADLAAGNSSSTPKQRDEIVTLDGEEAVFIVQENGVGVPSIRVALCRDEKLLYSGSTDQEGQFVVPADGLACVAVFSSSGRVVQTHNVNLISGTYHLSLIPGRQVSGLVIDTKQKRIAGLQVRLRSSHPLFDSEIVPAIALEEFGIGTKLPMLFGVTNEQGQFHFQGLNDSWSGIVYLQGRYQIESVSSGSILPNKATIKLSSPIEGLRVVVEDAPEIFGQLIEAPSGLAVDQVYVSARSTLRGGAKPKVNSAISDAEGCFSIAINPLDLGSLELYLGGTTDHKPPMLRLGLAEIPSDGDLGVIQISGLRHIPFFLRDRLDQPIAGGFGRAGANESKASDEQGVGVMRWLALEVTTLQFGANGFVPKEVKLTEPILNPLTVYLDRANRLLVKIVPPDGVASDQFRAQLIGEEVLIAGPANTDLELKNYMSEWTFPRYQNARLPLGAALFARPNSDGVVSYHALKTDVAMTLEIYGITGDTIYHSEPVAPLGAEEERELTVDLARSGRPFHGRVVDLDGNAIVHATVQLGGQILAWTDGEGKFSCLVVEEKPRTLVLTAIGSATRFIKNYQVPPDNSAVELKLEPALSVLIEVVDENNQPIPDAGVSIVRSGFTSNTFGRGNGRFEATSLSSEKVQIRTQVAGRYYYQDLLPAQATARVVIPLHGNLAVHLQPKPDGVEGSYRVVMIATIDGELVVLSQAMNAANEWNCNFPFVYPSTYEVSLNYQPSKAELADGMQESQVGEAVEVNILAGANVPLYLQAN
ncbi:MAG: hypothetical protein HQ519_07640 [Planctomycetes bacterium]|nr:hypothetical protein [Planctomycetota bacterium]